MQPIPNFEVNTKKIVTVVINIEFEKLKKIFLVK